MPKYLLQLRKTSFFLMLRSLDMSFGSSKASSTAEAMWHPMPPLKSLSDASSLRGSPPCMGAGSQKSGSGGWVSDLSKPRYDAWLTFCCFAVRWASSSRIRQGLPVLTTSFPFCSLFPFWISRFRSDRLRWVRSRKRRFGKRRGNLRLCGFPRCTFSRLIFYQLH